MKKHSIPSKTTLLAALLIFMTFITTNCYAQVNYKNQLTQMFHEMVEKKDISKMPNYYAKNFVLYSNGSRMTYKQFYDFHTKAYKKPIKYKVKCDDALFTVQNNRLAASCLINIKDSSAPQRRNSSHNIHVILIATFNQQGKIYRLWEATYPNWKNIPQLKLRNSKTQ